MQAFVLFLLLALASAASNLYGLSLVSNGPAQFGLVELSTATGAVKAIGGSHPELFGSSDLATVANGALYYFGDTAKGATLVALNLSTGAKICDAAVHVAEVSYVGIGQSLDYDPTTDTLLLSGVSIPTTAGTHTIYRAPATGCGNFTKLGEYGMAQYMPMLHSAALDPQGQRLFVTLGTGQQSAGIGIIDLKQEGNMTVINQGEAPDEKDCLVSLHFNRKSHKVFGLWVPSSGKSLTIHSLDPATGDWDTPRPLSNVPPAWNTVGGNSAVVSAYDSVSDSLYFMAGTQDSQGNVKAWDLARVDLSSGAIEQHPAIAPNGLCTGPPTGAPGGECIEALTLAGALVPLAGHQSGLSLAIYNNTVLSGAPISQSVVPGLSFETPLAGTPMSAEMTGTLTVTPGAQYSFNCSFGVATWVALHVDDHLVCQYGANSDGKYTPGQGHAAGCGGGTGHTSCAGVDNPLRVMSRTELPVRLSLLYNPNLSGHHAP